MVLHELSGMYVRAKRTGAAAREALWRDGPGGLKSPVAHACGSASPYSSRKLPEQEKQSGFKTTIIQCSYLHRVAERDSPAGPLSVTQKCGAMRQLRASVSIVK